MNDAQRIILWSGAIVLGLFVLAFGPRPTMLAPHIEEPPSQQTGAAAEAIALPVDNATRKYLQVTDGCGPYFEGACLNARSGPGTDYAPLLQLRSGAVLEYDDVVERDGRLWYRIVFDEWLRYPERAPSGLYVASDFVRAFTDPGPMDAAIGTRASTSKRIIVDRSDQMLYAYEEGTLFMSERISTGIELTPTPRGEFSIYRKTPTRYMQGPIPEISQKAYDLPGVPWNLYFTAEGAVIHGAYWHDKFGQAWSNGCVNMPPDKARRLYEWADLGTPVIVRD